jgi:hypothetical protein
MPEVDAAVEDEEEEDFESCRWSMLPPRLSYRQADADATPLRTSS